MYVKEALHVKEAINRVKYWVADVGHINYVLNLCFNVPWKNIVQEHRGKKKISCRARRIKMNIEQLKIHATPPPPSRPNQKSNGPPLIEQATGEADVTMKIGALSVTKQHIGSIKLLICDREVLEIAYAQKSS